MQAAVCYSGNQRRVLDALGLSPMRARSPAGVRGPGQSTSGVVEITLTGGPVDGALLAAIVAMMDASSVLRVGDDVRLRLPASEADGLDPSIQLAELRCRPDWKRRLWGCQRRLRRQAGG